MSLTDENWETNEFELKNNRMLRKLAPTHKTMHKDINLGFITYNSNLEVPCFKYDMVLR